MRTVKQFIDACASKIPLDERHTPDGVYYTAPTGYIIREVDDCEGEVYERTIKHLAIFPEWYDSDGDGIFVGVEKGDFEVEIEPDTAIELELLKVTRIV